jgi:competence protein CoiA
MKYALVNGERQEAKPGLSGKCECCGDSIVAKCGDERIWHWSHKGNRTCDPWWENQIEWHRAWKGQFPKEWQEIIHADANGEKHIADVKTDQSYVVEFQH